MSYRSMKHEYCKDIIAKPCPDCEALKIHVTEKITTLENDKKVLEDRLSTLEDRFRMMESFFELKGEVA